MNPLILILVGVIVAVAVGLGAFLYYAGVADGLDKARRIRDEITGPVTRRQCKGCWLDVRDCKCKGAAGQVKP